MMEIEAGPFRVFRVFRVNLGSEKIILYGAGGWAGGQRFRQIME
jgi:hypothetical protein